MIHVVICRKALSGLTLEREVHFITFLIDPKVSQIQSLPCFGHVDNSASYPVPSQCLNTELLLQVGTTLIYIWNISQSLYLRAGCQS
jgi:hypothetical protein